MKHTPIWNFIYENHGVVITLDDLEKIENIISGNK